MNNKTLDEKIYFWSVKAHAYNREVPINDEMTIELSFRAIKISRRMGYEIKLYEQVHIYHEEVLDIVFEEYFNGEEQ